MPAHDLIFAAANEGNSGFSSPPERISGRLPFMTAKKTARRGSLKPLESGQVWHLGDLILRIEMVGKLLVHYKIAKPEAVRTSTSVAGISTLLKFMKEKKAVLVEG
jgi:hypothetical protein